MLRSLDTCVPESSAGRLERVLTLVGAARLTHRLHFTSNFGRPVNLPTLLIDVDLTRLS